MGQIPYEFDETKEKQAKAAGNQRGLFSRPRMSSLAPAETPSRTAHKLLAHKLSSSRQEELSGWGPGDWRAPDQLCTRNGREERMGASSQPLPWTCNPVTDQPL